MNPAQLTVADLASIQNIIEVASNRGAFRANELTQVGAIYDKLSAFLTATQAQLGDSPDTPSEQTPGEQNA
jgi:hypothetical protein